MSGYGRLRSRCRSGHGRTEDIPAHEVYFTPEQEELLKALGIANLSAYVRAKMEGDAAHGASMAGLKDELARRRDELRELEAAFEARAVSQEETLHAVGEAAEVLRRTVRFDPRASFQSTVARWIHNHPDGQRLRAVLPDSVSDAELADILLKWPESRAQVQLIVEGAGP